MNRQITYILQGFLLLMVIIIGIWFIQLVLTAKETSDSNQPVTGYSLSQNLQGSTINFNKRGGELFQNNCSSCHALYKDLTGPALSGVEDRIKDKRLLYAWIRNNKAVLNSGNAYFNALYEAYNKTSMNLFPQLTDKDIDDILEYVKKAIVPVPQPAQTAVIE